MAREKLESSVAPGATEEAKVGATSSARNRYYDTCIVPPTWQKCDNPAHLLIFPAFCLACGFSPCEASGNFMGGPRDRIFGNGRR